MPKTLLLTPLFGALVGYAGATMAGVTNGLWIFLIAVICMIVGGIIGLMASRRKRSGV